MGFSSHLFNKIKNNVDEHVVLCRIITKDIFIGLQSSVVSRQSSVIGRQSEIRRQKTEDRRQKFGTLEPWNPGTLEPWNPGTLEPWNPGTG